MLLQMSVSIEKSSMVNIVTFTGLPSVLTSFTIFQHLVLF